MVYEELHLLLGQHHPPRFGADHPRRRDSRAGVVQRHDDAVTAKLVLLSDDVRINEVQVFAR
jgi:hypothetical protein